MSARLLILRNITITIGLLGLPACATGDTWPVLPQAAQDAGGSVADVTHDGTMPDGPPRRPDTGPPVRPDSGVARGDGLTSAPDLPTSSSKSLDLGSPDLGSPDLGSPDLGSPDLGSPDLASPPDTTVDSAPVPPPPILVTEMLINPVAVSDSEGEWLELHNPTGQAVSLDGWKLGDRDTNSVVLAGLTIPAGGYVIIARDAGIKQNGGVVVDQAVGNALVLANTIDEIVLHDASGQLVFELDYNSGTWPIKAGGSMSLRDIGLDPKNPTSWCLEPAPWPGSGGDLGSPGAAAGCQ